MIVLILAAPLVLLLIWLALGVILSSLVRRRPQLPADDQRSEPSAGKIAFLYLTCNDFNPSAFSSLLSQEQAQFDVFILDDSTRASERQRIDDWVSSHNPTVTIVRRPSRSGYKAGNINHWLNHIKKSATTYPYILLADADEYLPKKFAHRLLRCLESGEYAFAQGCHQSTTDSRTVFQMLLHPEVECRWFHHDLGRNFFGAPPMLGHGVLLRSESLTAVEGFPHLVSEDLALTILLIEKGMTGVIVSNVIGREEFPASYHAYWKRKRRCIQADAEVVRKMLGRLWRSPIGLPARLDLSIRELRLPVTTVQWALLSTVAIAAIFDRGTNFVLPPAAWALLPFALIPALPVLGVKGTTSMKRLCYVIAEAFVGATISPLHPISSFQGFFGHQNFEPTGDAANKTGTKENLFIIWEIASGLLFAVGGVTGGNLVLVAIGFAVTCCPLLRTRWESSLFICGIIIFWALILYQIYADIINGFVPIEHLVVLLGLLQHAL